MRVGLEISLPATPALLGQTRRTLRGYLLALGIEADVVADVVLAVDEACANVIRHAASSPDEEYELRADLSNEAISISINDHGPGFDLADVDTPSIHATSGRGLQIIEQLMSSVSIDRVRGDGTRLRMQRAVGGRADPRPRR